jgi:tetratricopeptide (TPR) repeat protein
MQLGSQADSFLDATGDPSLPSSPMNKDSISGIPRRELTNCEIHATAAGFRSDFVSLVRFDTFSGAMDVGVIVLQRMAKVEGTTLDAAPYKAPKDARKAYEKGLQAEKKDDMAGAQENFEAAVRIYPKFATAWFQLGLVLEKQNQKDAARKAFTEATAADATFMPAFLSLASMAMQDGNWPLVLTLTDHILQRDPLNHISATTYALDLDPLSCSRAYYDNAVANFMLNRMDAAEESGLKAEHVDLIHPIPQLHILLGEIFARKSDYVTAISELQAFLTEVPNAPNANQVRRRLAELQKLNGSASTGAAPVHQ